MSTAPAQHDLYAVLGIQRTASGPEIQAAYFRNVRRHPPEKDAEGFRTIHAAYEVLRNEKTRKEYDDTQRTDPEARELFDRGRQLLEDGKAAEALPLIKRALARQAESAVIRDLLTQALFGAEQFEEAEKQARRVLSIEPDNPTYSVRLGDILRSRDHDAEALPFYRKALSLDRGNSQYIIKLAYLLNYLDQTDEAIRLLEAGIRSDGKVDFDDFTFFQCLYTIYTFRERYEDLKKTRSRIRAILPPDADQRSFVAWFYYHNALMMADRGNFEAAVHSIEEAGTIDSTLPGLSETVQRLRGSRQLREELQKLGDDDSIDVGLRMTCVTLGFRTLLGGDDLKELFDKASDLLDKEMAMEGANTTGQIRLLMSRYPTVAKALDEVLNEMIKEDQSTPKSLIRLTCPNCGQRTHTDKPTLSSLTRGGLTFAQANTLMNLRGERGILQLVTFTCDRCHTTYNGLSERAVPTAPAAPTASSGCFVVTATYGDENAYPVRVLRAYRDRTLAAHVWGRALIRIYRVVGPVLARCIERWPGLRERSRRWCERVARRVDSSAFSRDTSPRAWFHHTAGRSAGR